MSEKAPHILGGTRPNVEKRFDVITEPIHVDENRAEDTAVAIENGGGAADDEDEEELEDKPSIYTEQAEDDVPEVTTIESLCMNCQENGMTKLLLTLVPYFREVILMSFECDHCGFKNSEVQFGGKVQEQGTKIELNVTDSEVGALRRSQCCCAWLDGLMLTGGGAWMAGLEPSSHQVGHGERELPGH